MMTLEAQQRGLLDLIKNRGASPADPYLRQVEGSPQLAMVREIALWWRMFALEAQCRFTSRLLQRSGVFQKTVAMYFDNHPTSPFVEELSSDFLHSLRAHPDPLLRAVSQSERALLQCKAGSNDAVEIIWDRHPDRVFQALEDGSELPPVEAEGIYRLRIDRELRGLVACIRETVLR
ncbi:MAG: hypothetical protein WBG23_11105 [Acidobacteriaceae bacterium]|jgi:hypothetical protein